MMSLPGGPYRKPQFDVYSVMLLVALVALMVATVLLVLEMNAYDWQLAAIQLPWPSAAETGTTGLGTC